MHFSRSMDGLHTIAMVIGCPFSLSKFFKLTMISLPSPSVIWGEDNFVSNATGQSGSLSGLFCILIYMYICIYVYGKVSRYDWILIRMF